MTNCCFLLLVLCGIVSLYDGFNSYKICSAASFALYFTTGSSEIMQLTRVYKIREYVKKMCGMQKRGNANREQMRKKHQLRQI